MSDEIVKYPELAEKGLNEEEVALLTNWLENGKPGLSKLRADRFGEIYLLGYTCQEIHKMFPEYSLEMLLFARAHYDWDKLRDAYRKEIQNNTLEKALTARLESIKFLSELVAATHIKWRKEIMTYIANPEKEKAPDCIPKSVMGYGQVVNILQTLMAPPGSNGKGSSNQGQAVGSGVPLVSVTVQSNGNGGNEVVISDATQQEIKAALLAEVGQDKE